MLPYWLLFLLVTAGASIAPARLNTLHRWSPMLVLVGLVITLMIGLRFEVGGDWITYDFMYEFVRRHSFESALEWGDPGYQSLSFLISSIGGDIWVLNLVCGLIFTWGLLQLARNQPSPLLAVLVAIPYLVIVVAMGYTRQAVAIGFIMAGLAQIERGIGIIRFAAYVALAALFHRTAIIVLPIVMFSGQRNRVMNVIAGLLLTLALYNSLLADTMDSFVKNYIKAEYNSQGAAIRVAMNVVPALVMLTRGRALYFGERQYQLWRLVALASFALVPALVLLPSSTVVDRLALYFLPIQIVVLPRVVLLFRNQSAGKLLIIGYSSLVLFVWLTFATHAGAWTPYRIFPFGFRSQSYGQRISD